MARKLSEVLHDLQRFTYGDATDRDMMMFLHDGSFLRSMSDTNTVYEVTSVTPKYKGYKYLTNTTKYFQFPSMHSIRNRFNS